MKQKVTPATKSIVKVRYLGIMLTSLVQVPEIEQYLKAFPRAQWEKCAALTLRLGIRTAKSTCPFGVTIEALSKAVASASESSDTQEIKEKLNRLKATLDARRAQLDTSPKSQPISSKLQSPPGVRDKQLRIPTADKRIQLAQPPLRLTSRGEHAAAGGKNVPPKHLQIVESKIKAEVKRDIERFKSGETVAESSGKRSTQVESSRRRTEESYRQSKESRPPLDFGGTLAEPKTNLAIVEKLAGKGNSPRVDSGRGDRQSKETSNVLRIADDFLSDPLMATLSAHVSPKFSVAPWFR